MCVCVCVYACVGESECMGVRVCVLITTHRVGEGAHVRVECMAHQRARELD